MKEIAENLGDIGTFGIFTLALLLVIFRYALPPILDKLRGTKADKSGQAPLPDVGAQLEALEKRLGKIEEAMETTNLGLVLHRIDELTKKVDEGFAAAKDSRARLYDEVDQIRETCAAEHGRKVGSPTGEWQPPKRRR